MTIQEVIKSGKPFRRHCWLIWFKRVDDRIVNLDSKSYQDVTYCFNVKDLLANDWIIDERRLK